MVKWVWYIALAGIFFLGYVKYIESRSIYFPTRGIDFTPAEAGLAFKDVYIRAQDGIQLNGWFIGADNARHTVLFCHGNAGNIGDRLDKILLLHKMQLDIFIFDYRGYGKSQGRPTEKGIYLDTKAAYDYLVNKLKINSENIVLYGESLGCAAVIHLAAEERTGALIIEGGFTRGRELAKVIYPFLPAFLFSNSFNSLEKIPGIAGPKLFIHSRDDEIVPFALAQRLYNAASGPKSLAALCGGHNSAFFDSQEKYLSSIESFIKQL